MSQAGFGDSSSQESVNPSISKPQSPSQSVTLNVLGETTTLFNALPRQVLEQELQFCNDRSQQAQILLRQAQEQLQLSQLVIQRQETLTQTLQSRIDHLESELQSVHTSSHELRDRLKRQQHHTSQLKAALERCLDTSTPKDIEPKDMALMALESWSIAKLADEKITPIEVVNQSPLQNVVKIAPSSLSLSSLSSDIQDEQGSSVVEATLPEAVNASGQSSMNVPISAPMNVKAQPISPLIVRPHRASQGSPIGLDLLNTAPTDESIMSSRIKDEPNDHNKSRAKTPFNFRDMSASPSIGTDRRAIAPNISLGEDIFVNSNIVNSNINDTSHSSTLPSAAMVSTVTAPKFIQDLYGHAHNAAYETSQEPPQLAIAISSPRKAVTSLAAVQLPQFPPLPRR